MDKKLKFMKWAFALAAIASMIAFAIIGAKSPIEAGMSVFGHWLKTFFMWCWVTVIIEVFVYVLGQVAHDWADEYKDKYGKSWFWKGIKDDFAYIKERVTWRKVLKYVLIYAGFFAACLLVFGVLEYLVP